MRQSPVFYADSIQIIPLTHAACNTTVTHIQRQQEFNLWNNTLYLNISRRKLCCIYRDHMTENTRKYRVHYENILYIAANKAVYWFPQLQCANVVPSVAKAILLFGQPSMQSLQDVFNSALTSSQYLGCRDVILFRDSE